MLTTKSKHRQYIVCLLNYCFNCTTEYVYTIYPQMQVRWIK